MRTHIDRSASISSLLTLLAFAAGCSTGPKRSERLPFHVAVPPVAVAVIDADAGAGNASALTLTFDPAGMTKDLVGALQQSFARVTVLSADAGASGSGWLAAARVAGADIVIDATLRYDRRLSTALNDRFWLNLPLFALGGPATWFVADRSYQCRASLEARVFDLGIAQSQNEDVLDAASQLVAIERQAEDASLNLIDRGGVGHFLLSILVPAGFVGTEATAVPEQVRQVISKDLSAALGTALLERADNLARSSRVDFHAEGVRLARLGAEVRLVGEVVLQLGTVSELGDLRCRRDDEAFASASWGETKVEAPTSRSRGRKRYAFSIPVGGAKTVQLEIEQQDRFSSKRTFTYPVAAMKVAEEQS